MTRQEIVTALENCIFGDYKFLYISPERLDTEIFRTKLRSMKVSMITVDESPLYLTMGYDRPPQRSENCEIRALLPGVPVLALTPRPLRKWIFSLSKFREECFPHEFQRKNLAYMVSQTDNKTQELFGISRKRIPGSALSMSATDETQNHRITNERRYHRRLLSAGLDNATKDLRQKRWQSGEIPRHGGNQRLWHGIDKA